MNLPKNAANVMCVEKCALSSTKATAKAMNHQPIPSSVAHVEISKNKEARIVRLVFWLIVVNEPKSVTHTIERTMEIGVAALSSWASHCVPRLGTEVEAESNG